MRGPEVSWNFWRAAAGLVLLGVVGIPLALPFGELVGESQGWLAWAEAGRILPLAGDTLALVGGALALTLPAGISAAILLYRTDLPLRGFLQFVLVLSLFVPLPLVASAWQAALGSGGWLPELLWHGEITPGFLWKPWVQGLGPAMWVHAAAAFPWVVLLVGQGLRWVESDLEEDALTTAGPWRVLNRVTLPRCQAALLAAALWVVLQTANEITVTDVMQVRTLAEEVYTQFVGGGPAALARAVAVSLPAMVLIWLLVLAATRRLERTIPPLDTLLGPSFTFRLGAMRWPALGLALTGVAFLAGVPLISLLWKAGLEGSPPAWSARSAWSHVATVIHVRGGIVVQSLLLAAVAGTLAAGLGLVLCWLMTGRRWFQVVVLTLLAADWAMPGPVVGFGLKETISKLLNLLRSDPAHPDPVAIALWYGPSPLPILWVYLLRFLPCAVALLWPVVRLLPREWHETALLEGASPWQDFRRVTLPLLLPVTLRATLAVAILALGEISASKLVETPGSQTFAQEIFDRMHYGVENDLAACCLVLLAAVVVSGSVVASTQKALGIRHWALLRQRPWKSPNACEPMPNA